ncbi:YegP family protein [Arenibacter sp. 6A1]|uniref:YegP family protein n=1 Tax=Arenibacter sp. 6A1 TaxID=2720391 RepID=UPI0014476A87|nr:YegP family protein [Arenibacter sp. 6A1]NKI25090.1 YegP family protein [Arenibacter sp. 6A1]
MITITKDNDNTHIFSLQSDTGQSLLKSVPYTTKESMHKTLTDLKVLVTLSSAFERKTNYHGKFFFILKDKEGKIIGNSMFYTSEAGMENGIKNLKKIVDLLPDTGLVDL